MAAPTFFLSEKRLRTPSEGGCKRISRMISIRYQRVVGLENKKTADDWICSLQIKWRPKSNEQVAAVIHKLADLNMLNGRSSRAVP